MNNKQKVLAKRYTYLVKAKIPYHTNCSRHMLENLSLSIEEYALENPDFTLNELFENFGTPEDISASLLDDIPSGKIIGSFKLKRKLFCIFLVLLTCLIYCIHHICNFDNHQAIGITEVIYTSEPTEMTAMPENQSLLH